ncbi:MAG: hypothetical protein IPP12_13415 [Nitrospira sp.]|nr:hypothetical protein [Nitrospira sp.]
MIEVSILYLDALGQPIQLTVQDRLCQQAGSQVDHPAAQGRGILTQCGEGAKT